MAGLLERIDFCTFTDVAGHLQAVVDLEQGEPQPEDPQAASTFQVRQAYAAET